MSDIFGIEPDDMRVHAGGLIHAINISNLIDMRVKKMILNIKINKYA